MSVHTVTVTKLDNMHIEGLADEEYVDEVEYTIDHCPGGTCTVWWGCDKDDCRNRDDEDDEFFAHGEDHQRIDGVWMIESKQCAARATDSGRDGMQEEAQAAGLGTHLFEIDYWGDGQWTVSLIKSDPKALLASAKDKVTAGEDLTEAELEAVWEALQPAVAACKSIMDAVAGAFDILATRIDWTALVEAAKTSQQPTRSIIHKGGKP